MDSSNLDIRSIRASIPIIYSHTALRGIAAMYVVVYHVLGYDTGDISNKNALEQFFQWGRHSVDLFFILSGFILNWVYLSTTRRLNWSGYLRARVARILPLYYLTTALFVPIIIYSFLKYGYTYIGEGIKVKLILNTLMVSGIISGVEGTINFPAWSISVEFFCYLAVFPLLVLLDRFLLSRIYGLGISIFLAAISTWFFVAWYHLPPIPINQWNWNINPLTHGIVGFSIGFFLCSIYRNSANWRPGIFVVNLVVLTSITILFLIGLQILPSHLTLYVFPFLVFYTAMDQGFIAKLFKTAPFQWLGERSYSIYLWHALFLGAYTRFLQTHLSESVFFVVVITLILGISDVSYRYFERPLRKRIRKLGQKSVGTPEPTTTFP